MKVLSEICAYLRNYFDKGQPKTYGEIVIENGTLSTDCQLKANQYFRIIGSTFNDGVYKNDSNLHLQLVDETFNGAVWAMACPPDFINIVSEITAYQAEYGKIDSPAMSPYTSESFFGDYNYSKSVGGSSDTSKDKSGTWQGAFGARLARWRKI